MSAENGEGKDGNFIICRCEEITRQEILDAIEEGYTNVGDIRRRTRAGMGFCQGNTCSRLIQELAAGKTGMPPAGILPARARPPVRPVVIEELLKGNEPL